MLQPISEPPSTSRSPSADSFHFSDYHWPLETLLRHPLLVTGDETNLTLGAAIIPLVDQIVSGSSGGGILLSVDPALTDALADAACRAGRQADLHIFRSSPRFGVGYPDRSVCFNLLSCAEVAPDDYARILIEPTVGEKIREGCLSLQDQADCRAAREQATLLLAQGIDLARRRVASHGGMLTLSLVIDVLAESCTLDPSSHRLLYNRFAPLLWDESLAMLFCGACPNTVSIDDVAQGRSMLAFDLPASHGGGEYASTVIKRLMVHRRLQTAGTGVVRHPLWLLVQADAAFLEPEELGFLNPAATTRVEAGLLVIVCASSPRLAAMCLGGALTDEGIRLIALIPNRIIFRPSRSELLVARASGEPDSAFSGIDGLDSDSLSDLGDRAAYCTRSGEPASLVRLDRLPGESRLETLAGKAADTAARVMPWMNRYAA